MNVVAHQESVSYQANVDWQEASTVWHAVDELLSYIRYKFVQRPEVKYKYDIG